jgi:uncharacterized protein YjbI with pentapeptide repeats
MKGDGTNPGVDKIESGDPKTSEVVTGLPSGSAAGLNLAGKELSGDLSGTDFRQAEFGTVDTVDEDEIYAPGMTPDAQGTEFYKANLTGANFAGRDLTGVEFTDCTLTGANFTGCIICGTDFSGANLTGAIFTNVEGIDDAYFTGATIDDIVGLSDEDLEYLKEQL